MLKKFFYLASLTVALFATVSNAKETNKLTVSVKSIEAQNQVTTKNFVAMVEYEDIYQIVSHVSGLVTNSSVTDGQIIKNKDILYDIKILDVGFDNAQIYNEYGEVKVIQTKIRQGQFVDKNEVLAYAVPLNKYKVVAKLLPNEVATLRTAKRPISVEILPQTPHAQTLSLSNYKIVDPLSNSPFYIVEFSLDCKKNICAGQELSSAVAKITIEQLEYETANIPITYLKNGLESVFVLNDDGKIELSKVQIVKIDDQFAKIKLTGEKPLRIVVDASHIPHEGERPSAVYEAL